MSEIKNNKIRYNCMSSVIGVTEKHSSKTLSAYLNSKKPRLLTDTLPFEGILVFIIDNSTIFLIEKMAMFGISNTKVEYSPG